MTCVPNIKLPGSYDLSSGADKPCLEDVRRDGPLATLICQMLGPRSRRKLPDVQVRHQGTALQSQHLTMGKHGETSKKNIAVSLQSG